MGPTEESRVQKAFWAARGDSFLCRRRIEDTDPLTIKRMETVDEEFLAAALEGGEPMTEEKNHDPDGMRMYAKCVR